MKERERHAFWIADVRADLGTLAARTVNGLARGELA